MTPHFPATRIALLLLAGCFSCPLDSAQAEVSDSFESTKKSWVFYASDCPQLKVDVHERVWGAARTGKRAEHLQIRASGGSYAYLTYDIAPSRLLDEFQPRMWVKSNRPGLQFFVRVVLPRSIDPKTGGKLTTLLPGDRVEEPGVWNLLSISNVRRLMDQAVPRLRREFGSHVDGREAYVDKIVLNMYGGPGATRVWIDDLTYQQFPPAKIDPAVRPAQAELPTMRGVPAGQSAARARGDLMMVRDRPWMAKIIEHNGEPLAWLKEQGFNAVMLRAPASPSELATAAHLGLWLIAPPPVGAITPQHDAIMAWRLGDGLGEREIESVRKWANETRRRDPRQHRPLLIAPASNAWDYRRSGDVFLLGRPVIGSQTGLAGQGQWWKEEPQRARLSAPLWASIPTQLPAALAEQATAHGAGASLQFAYLEPDQIRSLTFHAAASGMRGFVFRSNAPLDREDAATRMRAKTLALLLRELTLIEPWVAGGVSEGDIAVQNNNVRASVLRTERAQLLMITRTANNQQFVLGSAEREQLGLTTSTISTSAEAHRITFTTMQPMRANRVPGGFRLRLDDGEITSLVLLTQNPRVMEHVGRTLLEQGPMIAHLRYETAEMHWDRTRQIVERLAALGTALPFSQARIQESRAVLDQCRERLQGNDLDWAVSLANQAMARVASIRRGHWEQAVAAFPSPSAAPLCADFALLPEHWGLSQRMRSSQWGPNILPAGDFENLDHMLQTGWQRTVNEQADANAHVELALSSPRSGRRALRLLAAPNEQHLAQPQERAYVTISTAPIAMKQGQLARIHGWVRTAEPFPSGRSGLTIYDSFAGGPFGHHVSTSPAWTEFTLYRAAPRDDYLVVRFDLDELGDVMVDDLSISILRPNAGPSPRSNPTDESAPTLRGPARLGPAANVPMSAPANFRANAPRSARQPARFPSP